MKKIILFQLALTQICITPLIGQNVGINTTTPQSTLDVRGNQRIGGSSRFMSFDSVSGRISWTNATLFMPAAQAIIQHSASAEGLFYNNGQIEYRNQIGNPVFFTNWPSGNGFFRGKLGIGTTTPTSPLHIVGQESSPNGLNAGLQISNQAEGSGFNNWHIRAGASGTNTPAGGFSISDNNGYWFNITNNGNVGLSTVTPRSPLSFAPYTGNKISLWDDGNVLGTHYGIGIQSGQLQIHTNTNSDDIVFGSGKSTAFFESFRIKGNGAIAIRQNVGAPGQVLQSNGNQPATWVNKEKYYFFEQPAPFALTSSYQDVPGLNDVLFSIEFPCNLIVTVTSRPYRKMNEPVQYASASFRVVNHTTGIPIMGSLEVGGDLPDFGPGTYTTNHFTSTGYVLNVQPGPYRLFYRAVKRYVGGNCELTTSQIIIRAMPL